MPLVDPPGVLVWLPLEGGPLVRLDVKNPAERVRLLDWIKSQPTLAEIVASAEEASRAWDRGDLPRGVA